MAEDRSVSIEVVYRGIFQKTLAQRICRSVVLAARKKGHTGTAFARYGDSPERNGVPAKQFAVVAADELELEASMAKAKAGLVVTQITQKAIELLGPLGYSRQLLLEKWMRDAKLGEIEEGTSDIQRLIISRGLAKEVAR